MWQANLDRRVQLFSSRTVSLGGLPIAAENRAAAATNMVEGALARRGAGGPPVYVTSANGEVISRCARDRDLDSAVRAADVIHADGTPMVIASRLFCRSSLPERVATTDLFHDVAVKAEKAGASIYLLGARPAALAKAVGNVRRLYPDLRIAGSRHGFFRPEEERAVVAGVNACAPDILFVSLGVPREQEFVVRNRERLTRVGVVKTSGGLFDFLSGDRSRAPGWMQAGGLEWLYRLWLEPRRLFRRYAVTSPHALLLLVTRSA